MNDTDSVNSIASWASDLTTCEPLEKALSNFQGNTKFQRRVSEIVLSLKKAINKNDGTEIAVEFYASLLSFLKNTEVDAETMEACAFILNNLIRRDISVAVIRHTTSDLAKIVLHLFSSSFCKNENIVKSALYLLSKLLSSQSDDSWNLDNTTHMYRTLFSFVTDSRKNVNKSARKAILSIFQSKTKNGSLLSKKHPLNRETILIINNLMKIQNTINKKSDNVLKMKPSQDDERLSFSLTMIETLLKSKLFTSECIVIYLETLIQCLLSFQIVPIQCQILNTFSALFVGRALFPEQIARSITSLFSYLNSCSTKTTSTGNTTPVPPVSIGQLWLNTVLMGFESLLLNDQKSFIDSQSGQSMSCRSVALTHATNMVKFCSDWLMSGDEELSKNSSIILSKLCSGSLVTSEFNNEYLDPDQYEDADHWLSKWSEILCRIMLIVGYNNPTPWIRILENLVYLVVRSKGKCEKFLSVITEVVPSVAELRDSYENGQSGEDTAQELIGTMMKHGSKNFKAVLTESEKHLKVVIESFLGKIITVYGYHRLSIILGSLAELIMNADENEGDLVHSWAKFSKRTWIVPLIKEYTQNTSLDQFRLLILPCIHQLTKKIEKLSGRNKIDNESMDVDQHNNAMSVSTITPSMAEITLGTLRYQLWSCLPSFAKSVVSGGILEVSNNFFQSDQEPIAFPCNADSVFIPRRTLWDLIVLEMLSANVGDDRQSSNLEIIAMTTIRNIIKTAQDKNEMNGVLTSSVFFPKLLQNLFSLYMKGDQSMQLNIKATLSIYLPLFEPSTFDQNCRFLLTKKLSEMNLVEPSPSDLCCLDLLIILGPHLSISTMQTATEFVCRYLEGEQEVSNLIQKRAYRYLEIVTASNTVTSNEFSKSNLNSLLENFRLRWKKVKTDSWKCRMKTYYNIFKLLEGHENCAAFLNGFLSEIVMCLNLTNKKTRAVAGLLLVEAIISCSEDNDLESISKSLDIMLQKIVDAINTKVSDNSNQATQYKSALAKALGLILSENRLSRCVSRKHIVDTLAVVKNVFVNYHAEGNDRHLLYCAVDILKFLLKKKTANFHNIYLVDVGECLGALSNELRLKVRQPIKKILKNMLKLWEYETIKKCIPDELIPVLRNIHKSMNRSKRQKNKEEENENGESFATSWGGLSDSVSQKTMKNPHIKNIAELLCDTDSEDEDLKTTFTSKTADTKKSTKSKMSRASELRKQRKRKIDSANATLRLEEKLDDIVDLSDPASLVRHLRISDNNEKSVKNAIGSEEKKIKTVDKRGFHFEQGRLIIGKSQSNNPVPSTNNDYSDDDDNDNKKSEKERFQPAKKKMKKEKLPGSEYKAKKKGVFGDMKRKGRPDPYAYIPLNSTEQCHSIMKKHEKEIKKMQKEARNVSKLQKKRN